MPAPLPVAGAHPWPFKACGCLTEEEQWKWIQYFQERAVQAHTQRQEEEDELEQEEDQDDDDAEEDDDVAADHVPHDDEDNKEEDDVAADHVAADDKEDDDVAAMSPEPEQSHLFSNSPVTTVLHEMQERDVVKHKHKRWKRLTVGTAAEQTVDRWQEVERLLSSAVAMADSKQDGLERLMRPSQWRPQGSPAPELDLELHADDEDEGGETMAWKQRKLVDCFDDFEG